MLRSKTDAKCNRVTQGFVAAGSVKCLQQVQNQMIHSLESFAQMPYVIGKYQPKQGTDNIQLTACELP